MVPLLLLILHSAITFGMTGVIWFVQFIHYPIIQIMPRQETTLFEKLHWNRTLGIAIVTLTLELATGVALLIWTPPGVLVFQLVFGLLLLGLIWLTTWGVCVPQHCKLKKCGSPAAATVLMKANALRSILWTVRSLLVVWMLLSALHD